MPNPGDRCPGRRIPLLLALLALLSSPALADDPRPSEEPRRGGDLAHEVRALRLTEPVVLDGVLDESAWQRPSVAPLIQNEPDNGKPPRQPTDWWVAYDDEALYVAARLHDAAPESIRSRLGRRDTWPDSDWVFLNLDTFNDDRNAFSFSVNPAGTIGDSALYNDGWSDDSWDGVWDSATRIDEQGWTVEMRIPFSQLDFPDAEEQVWGINFSRRTQRYRGRDELFHRPRDESGYTGRFPDLVGLRGIRPGNRLEALVYGAARMEKMEVDELDPFRDAHEFFGDAGVDLKWGLPGSFKLNATLNPDFGQVEVDPAVVNLSDFETYFPEKRPFFVEDANLFRFGREGCSSNWGFSWMDPMPFYSRRIGRSPQLSLGDHDYADVPSASTIVGAGKLSGKVGGNTDVALLSAVTAEERADLDLDGDRSRQTVEPLTSYSVARVKKTRNGGHQGLGFMATHVGRRLDDARSVEELAHRAATVGIDGWQHFGKDGRWALRGFLSASRVEGSESAIDDLQRSSRRYFQRPDADHLDYDPTRTSMSGWSGRLMLNKQSGAFFLNSSLGAVSPGYELNDLGFQTRADQVNQHLAMGWRWRDPGRIFRFRALDFATYRNWDFGGIPDQRGYASFYSADFANYWGLWGDVFYHPWRNRIRCTRGGPVMRVPDNLSTSLGLHTDTRKSWVLEVGGNWWRENDGSMGVEGWTEMTVRPRSSLRVTLGPRLQWMENKWQWLDNVEDPLMSATDGVRHLFGELEYREFSLTTRVDWTFTPKLTLQTYIQPLIVSGQYNGVKELARPHSFDFTKYGEDGGSTIAYDAEAGEYTIDPDGGGPADPFQLGDPDFSFRSLKVNMVLRWEYRPGSTFYLVWTQDRANFENPGDFDVGSGSRALLEAPGDDIVLVKLTHWLDI